MHCGGALGLLLHTVMADNTLTLPHRGYMALLNWAAAAGRVGVGGSLSVDAERGSVDVPQNPLA